MRNISIVLFLLINSFNLFSQSDTKVFQEIDQLIRQKNFFQADEIYSEYKSELSTVHQHYFDAVLKNAFNQVAQSNIVIETLIGKETSLSDSLIFRVMEIKKDNAVKLFNYDDAANVIEILLKNYSTFLSEEKTKGLKNELKIWSALKDEPAQKITKRKEQIIKMTKDKAGLKNLGVSFGKNTIPFIFDTGANISTVTKSTARKMNMKIIPVDIEVSSITGGIVNAQLAISEQFKLADIEIHNAVFLVFDDSSLYFPHIDYQINGILGFPFIEALEEIQITQDDYFIIPKSSVIKNLEKNLALD